MDSVQSFVRAEVSRGASPGPKGAEAFPAYAITSAKDLIPEMENAVRLTLDHPMTFEILGEGLRLFEGWALRDLVNYSTASVAETTLSRASTPSLKSILQDLQAFGLVITKSCLPEDGDILTIYYPQVVKSAHLTEQE
jgi:hypothetical protein